MSQTKIHRPKKTVSSHPNPSLTIYLFGLYRQTLQRASRDRRLAATGLAVLLVTTGLWSWLAAGVHASNADQLIDAYLFNNIHTFSLAEFPATHTFLLKWPLFALMALLGNGAALFTAATILLALVTVGGLAYILSRIEKRPAVFGLWCLCLSLLLLLVPAQPYPGALLPVNMAMTTTRNIEYLVLIAALYLLSRRGRIHLLAGGLLLLLVILSDKLFVVLAAGAAGLLLLDRVQRYFRGYVVDWRPVARIVGALTLATLSANLIINLLESLRITGLDTHAGSSPFTTITDAKDLFLAVLYAGSGLLANFGANPIHGVTVVSNLPAAVIAALHSGLTLPYLVNFGLFTATVIATFRLYRRGIAGAGVWRRVSAGLLGAGVAAAAAFILTDHYYPVDARYLTICFFALVIAAATYWRGRPLPRRRLQLVGLVVVLMLPLAVVATMRETMASQQAMAGRRELTRQVASALDTYKIDRLVGNYWDVLPVKPESRRQITASAVEDCIAPRSVLNSRAWFNNQAHRPTAYLAIRDGTALAGPDRTIATSKDRASYNQCSLEKIVSRYGNPSQRINLSDQPTSHAPDVLLLLYPNGTAPLKPAAAVTRPQPLPQPVPVADPVQPVVRAPLPPQFANLTSMRDRAICNQGSDLQVVAHEDDDILFMNPDLMRAIAAGRCQRTVYMTAGDAGQSAGYWSGREAGAKAAYAAMYNAPNDWQDVTLMAAGHKLAVSYLKDVPTVSLVFLRLPDGNLRGQGFAPYRYQSLQKLRAGMISQLTSIDDVNNYSRQGLIDCLKSIIETDTPDIIRTQSSSDLSDGDHLDHHMAGLLTDEAAGNMPAAHYLGYPNRELPFNLSDEDIASKQRIFMEYAHHDGAVCQSIDECDLTTSYGSYLKRQYQP